MGCIAALLVICLSIFMITRTRQPEDLGSRLQYVGKKDLGCRPLLMFFFCDGGESYTEYYFATDLDQEGIKKYFNGAEYMTSVPTVGADNNYQMLEFRINNNEFWVSFYDSKEAVLDHVAHKQTNKPYIMSVTNSYYELAKSALR